MLEVGHDLDAASVVAQVVQRHARVDACPQRRLLRRPRRGLLAELAAVLGAVPGLPVQVGRRLGVALGLENGRKRAIAGWQSAWWRDGGRWGCPTGVTQTMRMALAAATRDGTSGEAGST